MKKLLFFAILIQILACQKENSADSDMPELSKQAIYFLPMKTGNYWIYEIYRADIQGNLQKTNILDSTFVAGDSIINGTTYKKIISTYGNAVDTGNPYSRLFLRDSSDCIVSQYGCIFSKSEFSKDIFKKANFLDNDPDTFFVQTRRMKQEGNISVPYGTFNTYVSESTIEIGKAFSNPTNPDKYNYGTDYFAKGVGMVKLVNYGYVNEYMLEEKRLLRYYVQ